MIPSNIPSRPKKRIHLSDETKRQNKLIEWDSLWESYAGHYGCTVCGEVKYCRAKNPGFMKCKDCFTKI